MKGTEVTGEFSPDGGTTWLQVATVTDATYGGPGFVGVLGAGSTLRADKFSVVGQ